jgi:hypothetical protein
MTMRDIITDLVSLAHPLPEHPGGGAGEDQLDGWSALYGDEDRDPLLAEISVARDAILAAQTRMRLLIAYGREFTRPRPYRLEDLARAAPPTTLARLPRWPG